MSTLRVVIEPNSPECLPDHIKDSDGCFTLDLVDANFGIDLGQDNDQDGCYGEVAADKATRQFTALGTKKNQLLLEDYGNPHNINSKLTLENTLKAYIFAGTKRGTGINVAKGSLVPEAISGKGCDITNRKFSVIDDSVEWVRQLQECCIKDLDLGTYHYDKAEVEMISQEPDVCYPDNGNIYYPAVFRGRLLTQETNKRNWQVEDFTPVPYLKFIIDKMFEKIGKNLKSDFFEKKYFRKLGVDILECFEVNRDVTDQGFANVGMTADQDFNFPNSTFPHQGQIIAFDDEGGDFTDLGGNYNDVLFQYVVPIDSVLCVSTCVFVTLLDSGTRSVFVQIRVDGQVVAIETQTIDQFGEFKFDFVADGIPVNTGDIVQIEIAPNGTTEGNIRVLAELNDSLSQTTYELKNYIPRGTDITLTDFIDKKYRAWDLMQDVIKLYGLKYQYDELTKTVCLEPQQDYLLWGETEKCKGFYSTNKDAINWTGKVDKCKASQITVAGRKQYYNFLFLNDGNDNWAGLTANQNSPVNEKINDLRFDVSEVTSSVSLSGECTCQLKFFATTRNVNVGIEVTVPAVTAGNINDGNGRYGAYSINGNTRRTTKHAPRIYYMQGWDSNSGISNWSFEGNQNISYPQAWQVNDLEPDRPNVAFDSSDTHIGIFDKFHKETIQQQVISGLLRLSLILKITDVCDIDFRRKYCIGEAIYILKRIENFTLNNPNNTTAVYFQNCNNIYEL